MFPRVGGERKITPYPQEHYLNDNELRRMTVANSMVSGLAGIVSRYSYKWEKGEIEGI